MKTISCLFLSATLLGGTVLPANADSLLGIIGGKNDSALVTIGSGEAGTSGLVNLGIGGGNNLVDANVLRDTVNADVSLGGGSIAGVNASVGGGRVLDADVTVGGSSLIDANVNVGGGLVDVGVGVGGGGGGNHGGGNNGGGNNGGGNNGGGNNGGGNNGGGNNGGGNNGGGVVPGGVASTGGSGNASANCVGISNAELQRLMQQTRIDGSWSRASGVNLQRIPLCPDQLAWLRSNLRNSGYGSQLMQAVASDDLLAASLRRASTGADRVLAVQRSGSQLTVYVY